MLTTAVKQSMEIKSLLVASITIIFSSIESMGQGAYFNAGFGYGFPAGDRIEIESPNGVEKNVYGSYGSGLSVGIGTGYMVNSNASFDLGIWYVMGSSYDYETLDTVVGTVHDRVSGTTVRIMPSVKISTEKKNSLYAKAGLVLGIATVLEGDETFAYPASGGSSTANSSFTYSSGSSFGWVAALGVDFNRENSTSIFVELNFCRQNFAPGILTVSFPGIPKLTYQLVDEPNPAAGDEMLKPVFPFSTIGITAGVTFSSSRDKKKPGKSPSGNQ